MRALVKAERKPGLSLQEVPVPKIGPNDLLIKVHKAAVCGTDLHIFNWDPWAQKTIPVPLTVGHEFTGEVAEVGSEVVGFTKGERVSGEGHVTCGHCRNCRAGKRHLCRNTLGIGVHRNGCFAEYLFLPAFNAFRVPKEIPDTLSAFFDPLGNAVHTALSFDLTGEDVLITGAGPIGCMAAAIARHVGARHVVVTDVNAYRLALAKRLGASRTVDVTQITLEAVMKELGMTEGFDVGMEMSGNAAALRSMFAAMNNGGRVALLGLPPSEISVDWNEIIFKGLILKGIYGREMFETWYKMVAMLQSGLDVSAVLTHRFPLADFEKAFEAMRSGQTGKVILELGELNLETKELHMFLAERSKLIDTENAFKIGPYIREVEESGHKVIKCNLGEPDFPVPEHIREEVKRQIDLDNCHYVDPQGILPLRKAVASYLSETRGLKITPERVVVYPGAKPPIGFSIQTYTNPGDEVVYPSPGFPIYESFIRYCRAAPKPIHLREESGFTVTGKELASQLSPRTRLIFLNFPSNPTGGVASQDQLRDLADAIVHHAPAGARVFSDEIYEKILFEGARHHSIASLPGMAERTIIVSGASKSYSWTGGRIGWAAYPTEEEAQIAKNLNINYFSCTAAYNQEGARVGIESPKTAPWIARMNQAFQERRDLVVAGLNDIPGVRCQKPLGAFYVFPNIAGVCESIGAIAAHRELPEAVRAKSSPSTLFQMFLLFRYQVATMDRKSFGKFGTEGMHFLRLSIATGLEDLKEAVVSIGRAARDREGFAQFVAEGKRLF